ncbi:MBOAT family protein [Sulfurimonas sp.]|uniref:MBOAT family O-acyltransferase n=1 Tax=Sulfurimonas sp. TaxID=2022749 RepID=UPI00356838BF
MIFSSLEFIVFFIIYFLIHAVIPNKLRIFALLISSAVFYSFWKVSFLWLPFFLITIAHLGLQWILNGKKESKKIRLVTIIFLLVLPLAVFKYSNFLYQDIIGLFFEGTKKLVNDELPLGISFITFTLIAYVVDISTNRYTPKPNMTTATTYTVFFPHLIAGPIMRPKELIPQFIKYRFHTKWFYLGLFVFSIGLVKKVVFADQLGLVVEPIYKNSIEPLHSILDFWLAFYSFPIQIYCDFSGYTDMAIGLAFMLGIRFPINFNRPYLAASIAEFWHRWHITLSHWIRDYIYIPLGGNRKGLARQIYNLMIAMGIAGLWHGASWTFILWGLVHGVGIAFSHLIKYVKFLYFINFIPKWMKIFIVFHLISLSWVLFRAGDLQTFYYVLNGLIGVDVIDIQNIDLISSIMPLILILVILVLHPFDTLSRMRLANIKLRNISLFVYFAVISFMWIFSIVMGTGSSAEFIYFDF